MNKQFFLKKTSVLVFITLITFLVGDLLRKGSILFDLEFVRYTAVSKAIVLFLYVIFIIVFFKKYYENIYTKKLIYFTVALVISFIIGQYALKDFQGFANLSSRNLLILGRYIYWLISAIIFIPLLIDTDNNHINKPLSFLEKIIISNALIIIISFVFDIQIFKTYANPERFGYMGIFNTHNQASYYYITFILYYYYKVLFQKKKGITVLVFLIFASLLIGTKKVYLFLTILGFYHFFRFGIWKKKYFYIKLASLITVFFLFYSQIESFVVNKFGLFIKIYNDKGVLTTMTSFRDELLLKTLSNTIHENWTFINYLFGGPRFHDSRIEFGLLDLYLFFGFVGVFVFYHLFKMLYNLTNYNKFYLFILIVVLLISFLASGFLPSANQPIMFLLISGYFIINSKKTSH